MTIQIISIINLIELSTKDNQKNIMTAQKCLVLHDLQKASFWISDSDLQKIFTGLVKQPNPKANLMYDEELAKKLIPKYNTSIWEANYSILVVGVTWLPHLRELTIVRASDLSYRLYKHLQKKEKNKWSVVIVPNQFDFVMAGNSVADFKYRDGALEISRYSNDKTSSEVNSHIVSNRIIQNTRSDRHLWEDLELFRFTEV